MCWTAFSASAPAISISPMWLTSNSPARVRTAMCSSTMPEYSTGMSQPPNSTMRAPRDRCRTLSGVFFSGPGAESDISSESVRAGCGWSEPSKGTMWLGGGSRRRRAAEQPDPQAGGRIFDEPLEPAPPRFLLFGAHDEEDRDAPIAIRLRLEERPRLPVCLELFLERRIERHGPAPFERIEVRLLRIPSLECAQARRQHAGLFDELLRAARVHRAPDAVPFPRREPDHVAVHVDALAQPVDPADAQRFVHRLGPGDARTPGVFLMEPDPQLGSVGVMLPEPRAEVCGSGEERGLHWSHSAMFAVTLPSLPRSNRRKAEREYKRLSEQS